MLKVSEIRDICTQLEISIYRTEKPKKAKLKKEMVTSIENYINEHL